MPPNARNSAVVGLLSWEYGIAVTRETRLYVLSLKVSGRPACWSALRRPTRQHVFHASVVIVLPPIPVAP